MGDSSIERPLLTMSKDDIYKYAVSHGLEWVEDSTNATDTYLRNRIRRTIRSLPSENRARLMELFRAQRSLAGEIDEESDALASPSRYMLTMVDANVALELLYALLKREGTSLTRPQREKALLAVKTAKPGSMLQAGASVNILFGKRDFIVKNPL